MAATPTIDTGARTGFAAHRGVGGGAGAAIAAMIGAAIERARARHAYRRLLACEDIMRDVGIDRAEVRRALMECGGRP
ncbi:MAG TPA: hypothetical protein VFN28_00440 [Amaricoccus sp.]|nr:hypothetical protein [Amaricoccus sp.]